MINTLQSRVVAHAFFENVFGLRLFASVKSVMDGCRHLEGFGSYRNSLVQEAKRGAEITRRPPEELLS